MFRKSNIGVVLFSFIPLMITTGCQKEYDLVDIPDKVFLEALIEEGVDTNGDGAISYVEAERITDLDVMGHWEGFEEYYAGGIYSLKGIEAFVNLRSLKCSNHHLSELDISENTRLSYLHFGVNQLTEIDLSANLLLKELYCNNNQIQELDVSKNIALQRLHCGGNQLTELDVSSNESLWDLQCRENQLSTLDLFMNKNLRLFHCGYNLLSELILPSSMFVLERLSCYSNQLTSLSLENCINLESLSCSSNLISSLDISNCQKLTSLNCGNMPTLFEICVWTDPFPPPEVEVYMSGSINVYFTTECSSQ